MTIALFGIVRSGQMNTPRPSEPEKQTGRRIAESCEMWERRLDRLCRLMDLSGDESLRSSSSF